MKGADKSFGQIRKDQEGREGELYSKLLNESGEYGNLESFEASSAVKRNELLFKLQADLEDTRNALKQAEELTGRLRRRVNELEGMYRILTKK